MEKDLSAMSKKLNDETLHLSIWKEKRKKATEYEVNLKKILQRQTNVRGLMIFFQVMFDNE